MDSYVFNKSIPLSLFIDSPDSTSCFTEPSSDELMRLIQSHGGKFHHYYSRHRVTHIIATNLPNSKIEKLNEKVVVKPQWILDR